MKFHQNRRTHTERCKLRSLLKYNYRQRQVVDPPLHQTMYNIKSYIRLRLTCLVHLLYLTKHWRSHDFTVYDIEKSRVALRHIYLKHLTSYKSVTYVTHCTSSLAIHIIWVGRSIPFTPHFEINGGYAVSETLSSGNTCYGGRSTYELSWPQQFDFQSMKIYGGSYFILNNEQRTWKHDPEICIFELTFS